jgi:hypothetical protein
MKNVFSIGVTTGRLERPFVFQISLRGHARSKLVKIRRATGRRWSPSSPWTRSPDQRVGAPVGSLVAAAVGHLGESGPVAVDGVDVAVVVSGGASGEDDLRAVR